VKAAVFVFIVFGLLTACQSYRSSSSPLTTVADVDLNRYQGKWHEIARLPNRFQRKCQHSTAEYSLQEDGRLKVLNTCHHEDGHTSDVQGVARIPDETEPGKLRLRFSHFPARFFESNYWILELSPDYDYAIVGEPKGRYLWILSRSLRMDELIVHDLVKRIESLGYESEALIFNDQIRMYTAIPGSLL